MSTTISSSPDSAIRNQSMHPKRRFGQNFLTGTHFPGRIVRAVGPVAGETILEIGPGHGALTGMLLEAGANVIAIELDNELVPMLNQKYGGHPRFRLVAADALRMDFAALLGAGASARVVANLPYNVATPILQRLLEHHHCLPELTLMFQREVAERIIAAPGGKEYGYLSVLCQYHAEAECLFEVPPGAFRPAPKIVSTVVRLRVRATREVMVADEAWFFTVVSVAFIHRRKTLLNNLRAAGARLGIVDGAVIPETLTNAGIDPMRRAETLTIRELAQVAASLRAIAGQPDHVPLY
ncbi:MAG: 16S rRNA (adenine(1518)-N(6)/adenine(1519)-N(6))-dimethyltransferase RsmA [Blastocatellia bacterium]